MALRSSIDPISWPAVLTGKAATLMALQHQLEKSQWWTPDQIRAAQFQQLRPLVSHALRNVPFYAERFKEAGIASGVPLTEEMWARIPILTRDDVRDGGDKLHAISMPPAHGGFSVSTTGGSTGIPVRVRKSDAASLMWNAIYVREELWHREDPRGKIARIRGRAQDLPTAQAAAVNSPTGLILPDWGRPGNEIWHTGKIGLIDYRQPLKVQAEFLQHFQPEYLYTHPSQLRLLAIYFRDHDLKLPSLRSVWTVSEVVDDHLRELCLDIFGCRIVNNYSSAEIGYIALQCPIGSHFHVQSETLMLEVLDAQNMPCQPGETGRVIVTPLANYAMPLLKYEIGDEAEIGGPCSCGRGLPVLNRIVGRSIDYIVLPSGERRRFNINHLSKIQPIQEFQLVQRNLEKVELLLAVSKPLSELEKRMIDEIMKAEFGKNFSFDISFHTSLPRTESGKLRPFISDILDRTG